MKTNTNNSNERQYYFDWMRILLIITVFLFHIGMIFNNFDWHIKNEQQFAGLSPIMSFLHLWRMPLLFLISGAGTYYALGKRTQKQYLKERFQRLVIPLIAGIFILVPVQVYIERIDQYDSLFNYYLHMFDGVYPAGNFSWHHLWFIAYLFLISLLISPLLGYLKSKPYQAFKIWLEKIVKKPGGMNVVIIPLLISQLLLKPAFPRETHDVVNDWAFISFNLIFFLAGFMLFVNPRIIHQIKKQKRLYLTEAILASVAWFLSGYIWDLPFIFNELIRITAAWSCSVAAISYAASGMNKNTPLRKPLNEAIYPFYLLHQPVIIILGYFVTQWNIPVFGKVVLITLVSFTATAGMYWYLIRPFNHVRVLFGMKKKREKSDIKIKENAYKLEKTTVASG